MEKVLIAGILALSLVAAGGGRAEAKLKKMAASPSAAVTITFDDGDATIFKNGFPKLKKYGLPATLYLSTSYIGQDSWYMNWSQVKTLKQGGWEIASHGYNHPDLTQLSDAEVKAELEKSKSLLASQGYNAVSFASPYGEYNDRVLKLIKASYSSNRRAWDDDPANEGLNDSKNFDRYNLSAKELTRSMSYSKIKKLIDRAVKEKKWLVFYLHSVVNSSPREYEFKASVLDQVTNYLNQLKSAGKLKVGTIQSVVEAK